MYVRLIALMIPLAVLAGCYTAQREYHYDIDLINRTDRPVTVEFLRGQGYNVGKVRVDLAPGGAYVSAYTSHGTEYLEARVRFLDDPEPERFYVHELGRGPTRRDIVIEKGGLTLTRRPDPDGG